MTRSTVIINTVLFFLTLGCSHLTKAEYSAPTQRTELVAIGGLTDIGSTSDGYKIKLGGFSGLDFLGLNKSGNLLFATITDRGPNADSQPFGRGKTKARPFALPTFQPRVVIIEYDSRAHSATVVNTLGLVTPTGKPISGLPNYPYVKNAILSDELPIDLNGKMLMPTPYGLDLEGITRAKDGSYWFADEYRPSLCHFSSKGKFIERFIPIKGKLFEKIVAKEALPANLVHRKTNRGFEGIAYHGGWIFSILQSPLEQGKGHHPRNIHLIVFDTKTKQTIGQYLYPIGPEDADKVGGLVAIDRSRLLVLQHNSKHGKNAFRKVVLMDLSRATNLETLSEELAQNPDLIYASTEQLADLGVTSVEKKEVADLTKLGYEALKKPEGIALIGRSTIALINDNDFGVQGEWSEKEQKIKVTSNNEVPYLGIINLEQDIF